MQVFLLRVGCIGAGERRKECIAVMEGNILTAGGCLLPGAETTAMDYHPDPLKDALEPAKKRVKRRNMRPKKALRAVRKTNRRAHGPLLAMIFFGTIGVACGVAFLFRNSKSGEQMPTYTEAGAYHPTPEAVAELEATGRSAADLTARLPEAKAAAEAFYRATTVEEKAALIHDGAKLLPVLRGYYALHPDEDEPDGEGLSVFPVLEDTGHRLCTGLGRGRDGRKLRPLLEWRGERCLVDWRATTGLGEMEWADFLAARPSAPQLMRVIAQPDEFYAGDFSDKAVYACYRLHDAANTADCYAYLRRDHPAFALIQAKLATTTTGIAKTRLTLSLQFPPSALRTPQTVITAFDGRFEWLDIPPA